MDEYESQVPMVQVRWLKKQLKYSDEFAAYLEEALSESMDTSDRLRADVLAVAQANYDLVKENEKLQSRLDKICDIAGAGIPRTNSD